MASRFIVTRVPGPHWDPSRSTREQAGWGPHAAFMDGLLDDGFVAYGGPSGDTGKVVLATDAPDPSSIRTRLALDPWTEADLLRTAAIEPWTIWLGDDAQLHPSGPLYLVAYAPGPDWNPELPRREQSGWDAHARFLDGLCDQGIVCVGGPLDERRALLVMRHDDAIALRALLEQDPWVGSILQIEAFEPWTLWLGPRLGSRLAP
jgi:hypothetical protein